ncbi:OpgC family protein [Palleronia sp.]|uniref:OpgC family protein n=1 Tax=Palleronia sp. TaxID=1940284 RepID=UPI0035C8351B
MPENKVVPLPGTAARVSRRDPRIDAFRGLALVMIIVTHMPGNPWEWLTVREWGFSDAAEAFFLMSGIAAGIAYSPAVERWLRGDGGIWAAISPMWARAWTLYLVQILLTVIAIGLFAWAADVFLEPRFREMHNLARIYSETGEALAGIPTLGYQIGYVNILPTYIVLMIAAPAIVAAGLRWPLATLAASAVLWHVSGLWRLNIPNHPGGGGWFFSPTSWQLIFTIGLLIGIRHRKGERLVPQSRPLFAAALGLVVFIFAWRHVPELGTYMNHKMAQLGALGAPGHIVAHTKTWLGLPRLVHVLALAYVLSCLPAIRTLAAHPAVTPLRTMGQQGLLVFAFGTVLMLVGQILMDVEPATPWLPWVLPPAATALCWAAAWTKNRLRAPKPSERPAVSESSPMRRSAAS